MRSLIVHLWFEVSNWYWIFEWIDLPNLQSITLGDDVFNYGEEYCLYNLNSFETLKIGDDCFGSVKTFKIDGLNRLKTIIIGTFSFGWSCSNNGDDYNKSFHILNCENLESIQIGEDSFRFYSGDFELKNLPQLEYIQFDSRSFCCSSFVIRGIELILNIVMIRSSKSTIHYIGWGCILWFFIYNIREYWMNSNEMIWIDLPSLQTITLGQYALIGPFSDSCSLTMRSIMNRIGMIFVDLPNLTSINSKGMSFKYSHVVTLESISEYWILKVFRYSKSSRC